MASTDEARMLTVTARQNLTSDVVELTLRSLDGSPLPAWKPGAHIDLRLGADLVRQYSLIQTDDPSTWTIAVLVEPEGRGGSKLIGETVHVGSVVEVGGPRNHFPFVTGDRYLFIAGGIGVTPLIGMCRNAQADGADWRLVYAGRNRLKMAYVDQLEAEFPDRVEIYDLSEGQLFSVEDAISELDTDTHVYCCGPESLLDAVEDAMGAPSRLPYVHVERFRPREPAGFSENVEFTVYAQTSDVEFVVPEDESILMAADFEGVIVPGDCLEGTCGSCETRVLEGEVEHRDSIFTAQQRQESTTMMICVSRAKPGCDRLVLDL